MGGGRCIPAYCSLIVMAALVATPSSGALLRQLIARSPRRRRVFDQTVYFCVANGTPCTMHSLAWNNPEEEHVAFQAIAKSTPGWVIDLPTPPDHIIIDVKSQAGMQWSIHLNLAPDSNFICIPIGLTS